MFKSYRREKDFENKTSHSINISRFTMNVTCDTSTVDHDRVDSGSKSPKSGSDNVLYVIAWATLGQAMCFLIVAMFLDDVTVLPTDPLTIIGTTYVVMGITFMIISCFLHKIKQSQTLANKETNSTIKTSKRDLKDDGELSSQQECVDTLSDGGVLTQSEHEADGEMNSGPGTSETISDIPDGTDSQWQILDSGTRARTLPATSNTTMSNETHKIQ